jgi:hypothetical protein
MCRNSIAPLLLVAAAAISPHCLANLFIMPKDGDVYISGVGGTGGAISNFGLGHSIADFQPFLFSLPAPQTPEVDIGHFATGQVVPFAMFSNFLGTFYAFSTDTTTAASRTAFMDLDNSLGLGGGVIENKGPDLYQLDLDDAASFAYDDNDNDLLVSVRIAVPEPGALLLLAVGAPALLRRRRIGLCTKELNVESSN